jgi:hypothetical protein
MTLAAPLGFSFGDYDGVTYPAAFDHDSLRARLLEQFKRGATLNAVLGGFLRGTQDLADVAHDLLTKRLPDAAEGAQVDVLGAHRGVDREGRTDAVYLGVQEAFALARRSCGTIPDIYGVLQQIVPGGAYVIEDLADDPASLFVLVSSPPLPNEPTPDEVSSSLVALLLRLARVGGVRLWFQWWSVEADDTFVLCEGDDQVDSTTQGFADEAETLGGYLVGEVIA